MERDYYIINLSENETCEAMDVIRGVLGTTGFVNFCRGCAIKYLVRAGKKQGNDVTDDFKKARDYLFQAINTIENANPMYWKDEPQP